MTRWSDASGFFLLETMGVAAVLIVMAGALMLFRQGVLMEEQTRFEAAATCLAESELAHIEYRATAGTLTEGASERREYVVFSPAAIGSATEDETGGDFLLRTDIQRMEQEGTYPLPEAQLDRFMLKIMVDFPSLEELGQIVGLTTVPQTEHAQKVADAKTLLEMRAVAQEVPIAQAVRDFALRLVLATHPEIESSPENVRRFVRFGASPRAAQAIIAVARVRALMAGRYNVAYEDIEALAPACLRHRIALSFEGMAEGETAEGVIAGLLKTLPRE